MAKLESWLLNKEMFGVFDLKSIAFADGALKAVLANEIYKLTISFPGSVLSYQVTEAGRKENWLETLRADYGVLMCGNTFFKLSGTAPETHYLIAAPNYVVEIYANSMAAAALEQADGD